MFVNIIFYIDLLEQIIYNLHSKIRRCLMQSLREKSKERIFYLFGLCLLPFGLALFFLIITDQVYLLKFIPSCTFYRVTHLYCPGCGATRSSIALLTGHPIRSFLFHPAIPYFFVMYVLFMVSNTISLIFHKTKGMTMRNIYIYIGIAILFIQWIVKNLFLIL